MSNDSPFDSMARQLFGDSIDDFARGSQQMEEHALDVCRPTTIALQLPEEYAVLALTSRMDRELEKILKNGLVKQGDAKRLLFDTYKPLGSFAAKIDIAYCVGFMTEKMYQAITLCRKIRNLYAHSEDPHAIRKSEKYQSYRKQLFELDCRWTAEQINKLSEIAESNIDTEPMQMAALMVGICDRLGTTANFSIFAPRQPQCSIIPCFHGFDDAPELRTVSGDDGFFGQVSKNLQPSESDED
jgi:hypothetical protein